MIKSLMMPLMMATALALSACAGAGTLATAASVATSSMPIGDRLVVDEKAMIAAETFYNIPANAYFNADTNGLVTPAIRSSVRPILIKMGEVLDLLRAAYRVGDATSFRMRYRQLEALKVQATALIPR